MRTSASREYQGEYQVLGNVWGRCEMKSVEPWPASPDDSIEKLMAAYKAPGILVIPKEVAELTRATQIIANAFGVSAEEAARALTPEKKPESIREILDAPMRKWREE